MDLVDSTMTGKKTEVGFTLKIVLEDDNSNYSARIQINLFTVQCYSFVLKKKKLEIKN